MFDHIQDKNHAHLYKLSKQVRFPSYVIEAEIPAEKEAQAIPTSAFADQFNRRYPVDSKANTWLSSLYFDKFAAEQYSPGMLSIVSTRLNNAKEMWDLEEFEHIPQEKTAAINKVSFTDGASTYHTVEVGRDTETFVKTAEEILYNYQNYPYKVRKNVATQLLRLAPEFPGAMTDDAYRALEKAAGQAISTRDNVLGVLDGLRPFCKNTEYSEKLAEARSLVETQAADYIRSGMLEKIAGFVDAIDRFAGIHNCFDTQAPEQKLFTITVSDGENLQKSAIVLTNNKLVSKRKLEENKEAVQKFLEEVCGTSDLQKLSKREADALMSII